MSSKLRRSGRKACVKEEPDDMRIAEYLFKLPASEALYNLLPRRTRPSQNLLITMCDTTLAFGENGALHFECPSRWYRYVINLTSRQTFMRDGKLIGFDCSKGLPKDIQDLFNENVVLLTYHLAFGPNGAYIFSYKTKLGTNKLSDHALHNSF
jgi:hypothetical protein